MKSDPSCMYSWVEARIEVRTQSLHHNNDPALVLLQDTPQRIEPRFNLCVVVKLDLGYGYLNQSPPCALVEGIGQTADAWLFFSIYYVTVE